MLSSAYKVPTVLSQVWRTLLRNTCSARTRLLSFCSTRTHLPQLVALGTIAGCGLNKFLGKYGQNFGSSRGRLPGIVVVTSRKRVAKAVERCSQLTPLYDFQTLL